MLSIVEFLKKKKGGVIYRISGSVWVVITTWVVFVGRDEHCMFPGACISLKLCFMIFCCMFFLNKELSVNNHIVTSILLYCSSKKHSDLFLLKIVISSLIQGKLQSNSK